MFASSELAERARCLQDGGPVEVPVAKRPRAVVKAPERVVAQTVGEAESVGAAAEAVVVDPATASTRVSELLLPESPRDFFWMCFSLKFR